MLSRKRKLVSIMIFFVLMAIFFGAFSYQLWISEPEDFLLYFAVGFTSGILIFLLFSGDVDPLDMSWKGIDIKDKKTLLRYLILISLIGILLESALPHTLGYQNELLYLAAWYTVGLGVTVASLLILPILSYFHSRKVKIK